jgi:hypothetical protein
MNRDEPSCPQPFLISHPLLPVGAAAYAHGRCAAQAGRQAAQRRTALMLQQQLAPLEQATSS